MLTVSENNFTLQFDLEDFESFKEFVNYQQKNKSICIPSNNWSDAKIDSHIHSANNFFNKHYRLFESDQREINWESFNKLLIKIIRCSSIASKEIRFIETTPRSRERVPVLKAIGYKNQRGTDPLSQYKIQALIFLIFSKKNNLGYVITNTKYVSNFVAIKFLAGLLIELGLEEIHQHENFDSENNDDIELITNKYKIALKNLAPNTLEGFPKGVKINSANNAYPLLRSVLAKLPKKTQ